MKKRKKSYKLFALILILAFLLILSSKNNATIQNEEKINNLSKKETFTSGEYSPDEQTFLNCDSSPIYLNEKTNLLLYLYGNSSFTGEIYLYLNDDCLGMMNDDGVNGDKVAGDYIYSYEITVLSTELNEKYDFYAKCGNNKTKHYVEYSYNDGFTDEDWDEEENLCSAVNAKIEEHLVDGYVPILKSQSVYDELYDFILEYINQNNVKVIEVNREEDGISILFSSGILLFIDVPLDGVDSGLGDEYISIRTIEPYYSSGDVPLKSFESNALYLQNNNIYCTSDLVLKDKEVSIPTIIDAINKDNSIILWHGHGCYIEPYGSLLCTTISATDSFREENKDDINDHSIIILKDGTVTLSSKFFNKYLSSMDNSFVYLGACKSYKDKRLADAFLDKNASAVLGFSETVYTSYDCAVMDMLSEELCKGNNYILCTQYQSIESALDKIKECLGENDIEYAKRFLNIENYKDTTSYLTVEGDLGYSVGATLATEQLEALEDTLSLLYHKFEEFKNEIINIAENPQASLWEYIKEKILGWIYSFLEGFDKYSEATT